MVSSVSIDPQMSHPVCQGEAEYAVVLLFSESDRCEGVLKVLDKLDIKPGCRFYGNLYVLLQSIVMDIKSRLMASDNTFGQ